MQQFVYNFNISGNFSQNISQMSQNAETFTKKAEGVCEVCEKWAGRLAKLNLASDYLQNVSGVLKDIGSGAVTLDSQMHDLSAVAGVTGEGLKP